jgi:hypothetical protein
MRSGVTSADEGQCCNSGSPCRPRCGRESRGGRFANPGRYAHQRPGVRAGRYRFGNGIYRAFAVANYVSLSISGLTRVAGTGYNGSSYSAVFFLPITLSGPVDLIPTVRDASTDNTILGVTTTIAVRPTTPPLSLSVSQPNDILTAVGGTDEIYVAGNYSGGLTLDLTSSASGTTYTSSNTNVLTVDTEGNVTATGFGTAVVTVANMGVRTFKPLRSKTRPRHLRHRI